MLESNSPAVFGEQSMAGSFFIGSHRHARSLCRATALVWLLLSLSPHLAPGQAKGFDMSTSVAPPGRRLALVIGNKDYPWKPLANPVNDATDVAAALKRDGFKVNLATNLRFRDSDPARDMKAVVREFVESVQMNDFAFVYYSGHGEEVFGINYLLPIDLPANASAGEVEDEAVSAQRIANDLEDRGAAVRVIVLDACRDNPIKGSRSARGGLAPMEGLGSLIVFATEARKTASDNSGGRNGLFTQYLLKALTAQGVSLDDAVRDVARQMAADTNRQQVPAIYGLLERPVFLVNSPVTVNVSPPQSHPDAAFEAWNAIKDTHDPQDLDDFVAAFPQSPYAASARLIANRLRRESAAASQPKPAPSEPPRTAANEGVLTLAVGCDLACDLQVDGVQYGTVQPGDAAHAEVAPGEHVLLAKSIDGRDRTSQTVTGIGGTTKSVILLLNRIREHRIFSANAAADRGLSLYNQKDYEHSLTANQEACEGGNGAGCSRLGRLYQNGLGTTPDDKKAADYYAQGCDLGDMPSCYGLGYLYEYGGGVNQEYPKALALYSQACHSGYLLGCTNLGWMYKNGRGVPQDYSQAFSLFKQACDGNEMIGCENLGDLYQDGQSVPVNLDKARELFAKSCSGGHNLACIELKALDAK